MMNKNNDSKLALLTSVVLGSLVLFLIFLCHKLILCIARVFVYLTGLATVLLVTVFYIFIILFLSDYRFKLLFLELTSVYIWWFKYLWNMRWVWNLWRFY